MLTLSASNSNIHFHYFIGACLTIFASSFVIISYALTPEFRYNPSVLIFYRSFIDFALGICIGSYWILDTFLDPTARYNAYTQYCDYLGGITQFFFFCSVGNFIALVSSLYKSVKNPFTANADEIKPFKINLIIISICGIASMVFTYCVEFSYKPHIQLCVMNDDNIFY